jgi:hypothetical protein
VPAESRSDVVQDDDVDRAPEAIREARGQPQPRIEPVALA